MQLYKLSDFIGSVILSLHSGCPDIHLYMVSWCSKSAICVRSSLLDETIDKIVLSIFKIGKSHDYVANCSHVRIYA